ncbi:MAG: Fic family protein [Lachnospiraceae bacterium]|nr:Fic family protein [Lachnospiraceae bacterium]
MEIVRIHHRMTVIHAFRDGNGRTSRTFINMLFLRRHMPPVFFKDKVKE